MNNSINDGEPAFPFGQVGELTGQPINGFFNPGMSLRDWFAGEAMKSIIAACPDSPEENVAISAYRQADAMLVERVKGGAK